MDAQYIKLTDETGWTDGAARNIDLVLPKGMSSVWEILAIKYHLTAAGAGTWELGNVRFRQDSVAGDMTDGGGTDVWSPPSAANANRRIYVHPSSTEHSGPVYLEVGQTLRIIVTWNQNISGTITTGEVGVLLRRA